MQYYERVNPNAWREHRTIVLIEYLRSRFAWAGYVVLCRAVLAHGAQLMCHCCVPLVHCVGTRHALAWKCISMPHCADVSPAHPVQVV